MAPQKLLWRTGAGVCWGERGQGMRVQRRLSDFQKEVHCIQVEDWGKMKVFMLKSVSYNCSMLNLNVALVWLWKWSRHPPPHPHPPAPPTPCHPTGPKMLQYCIRDRFGYCVSTQWKNTILVWCIHSGLIYTNQNVCAELRLHAGYVCCWPSRKKCRAWLRSKAEHSLHCALHYTSSVTWKCVRHRACLEPWTCGSGVVQITGVTAPSPRQGVCWASLYRSINHGPSNYVCWWSQGLYREKRYGKSMNFLGIGTVFISERPIKVFFKFVFFFFFF